jgi:hypothetical protein
MPFEREIAKNKLKKRAPMGGARAPYTTTSKKKTPIGEVAKRFGITAREARDIATAVGTLGKAAVVTAQFPGMNKGVAKSAAKNLVKQVKETGTAAKSGKKGTTSSQALTTSFDKRVGKALPSTAQITKGKKRK